MSQWTIQKTTKNNGIGTVYYPITFQNAWLISLSIDIITKTGITSLQRIVTNSGIDDIQVSLSYINMRISGDLDNDTFGMYHLGY